MKPLKAVLLSCVLFALLVDGATASTSAGLDPAFGNGGKTTVAVSAGRDEFPQIQGMALGPEGRVYVLRDSLLFAFEADGTPAAGFGGNGQVAVVPVGDDRGAVGLAVDSRGRVLVAGSVELGVQEGSGRRYPYAPVDAAYVIRLLPDGERDITFGDDGEVQTDFGLPRPTAEHGAKYERASAVATSIIVDSQDRPIIGGGYAKAYGGCETLYLPDPFVGRLTVDGAPDTTFAGRGYALIGGHGEVSALARTPEDGPATLSYGVSCGARSEDEASRYSAFTEDGERAPKLDPKRPRFYGGGMTIDPEGRILFVQTGPPAGEGPRTLDRLLPNGDFDRNFGKKGRVIIKGAFSEMSAFTVDAQGRPILATARHGLELRRLSPEGALDRSFGPGGRLYAQAAFARALALDGDGRIYTAGLVHDKERTSYGVQVARFLPGG
jgi:uncharacterized delta-60 repeat protein